MTTLTTLFSARSRTTLDTLGVSWERGYERRERMIKMEAGRERERERFYARLVYRERHEGLVVVRTQVTTRTASPHHSGVMGPAE